MPRVQRRLSRKKKGSSNRKKASLRLQKVHKGIANLRSKCLHQLCKKMTSNFRLIGIEDLNVKEMLTLGQLERAATTA